MKMTDYYLCRAYHRKLWSTIARLNDETIIKRDFDIDVLKQHVGFSLGIDGSRTLNNAFCYACFWTYEVIDRGCVACPICINLGSNCRHNAYGKLTNLTINYARLECSAKTIYWKAYLERFRNLALEMANAW